MTAPRGPDPDDESDPSADLVEDFIKKLKREGLLAQRALISYNEGNETTARSIITWAAGIASLLLVAGILGGLSLSNQLAVTTQKVITLESQAQQSASEHRQDIQELKTEVQGMRNEVRTLADEQRRRP